ncbi:unnamed protein product [Schistosoma curassoni]|uniref:COX2_TM domain-containing protein n=1 Tax=Schistosoma curassoni TaxID=6186 RepID=A0A183KHE2_9TREM|nr:unnamed protein product [Schistosoma curassoni]
MTIPFIQETTIIVLPIITVTLMNHLIQVKNQQRNEDYLVYNNNVDHIGLMIHMKIYPTIMTIILIIIANNNA